MRFLKELFRFIFTATPDMPTPQSTMPNPPPKGNVVSAIQPKTNNTPTVMTIIIDVNNFRLLYDAKLGKFYYRELKDNFIIGPFNTASEAGQSYKYNYAKLVKNMQTLANPNLPNSTPTAAIKAPIKVDFTKKPPKKPN